VGDRFQIPLLKKLEESFNGACKLSTKAKNLFVQIVRTTPNSGTRIRWWSRWENYNMIMENYPAFQMWLDRLENEAMCENTVQSMRELIYGEQRDELEVEMATVVDLGARLVKATYVLEGDSFLAPSVYNVLRENEIFLTLMKDALARREDAFLEHMPNTRAHLQRLAAAIVDVEERGQWFSRMKAKIKSIIRPMLDYYLERFKEEDGLLSHQILLFKRLRLFDPFQAKDLAVNADQLNLLRDYDIFEDKVDGLVAELPAYLRLIENLQEPVADILLWFKAQNELPTWYACSKICALIQPSSGASERVFSLLKHAQDRSQTRMLEDYLEASVMIHYNDLQKGRYEV
jgi:hypothetical protein